jgi:CDP-glucose 4,6-dehydratase
MSACRNSYSLLEECRRQGVALASARTGNVIGGGDWAEDRLVLEYHEGDYGRLPIR